MTPGTGSRARPFSGRPPTASIGPALRDFPLRLISLALACAMALPLWFQTPLVLLPIAVFAAAAFLPYLVLPLVSLVLIIGSFAANVPPGSPALLLYVAGLHLLYALYAVLLGLPRNAEVSAVVLTRGLVAVLRLQAVAQPVAIASLFVHDAGASLAAVLAAAAALIGWGLWMLRAYRRA